MPTLPPRARLGLLAGVLLAAFLAFWVFGLVSEEQIRERIDPLGALAPVAFVLVAAALGAAMVPGPLLAGASGVLFGTALGTLVTITSAIGSAVVALLIGRSAGAGPAGELAGPRYASVTQQLRRHGTLAVVAQRLVPGVPDAPCSYAAGVIGLRVWQIALGTLIGSLPRAFSYTALGDSLDDPIGPLAGIALGVLALAGATGALLARRAWVGRPRDGVPGGWDTPGSSGRVGSGRTKQRDRRGR